MLGIFGAHPLAYLPKYPQYCSPALCSMFLGVCDSRPLVLFLAEVAPTFHIWASGTWASGSLASIGSTGASMAARNRCASFHIQFSRSNAKLRWYSSATLALGESSPSIKRKTWICWAANRLAFWKYRMASTYGMPQLLDSSAMALQTSQASL